VGVANEQYLLIELWPHTYQQHYLRPVAKRQSLFNRHLKHKYFWNTI